MMNVCMVFCFLLGGGGGGGGGGKFAVGIKFTKDFICRQNTMKQNYNYIVCLFVSRIWER